MDKWWDICCDGYDNNCTCQEDVRAAAACDDGGLYLLVATVGV